MHLESLGKCSRLAMACKNEALDVVKTVTHKRGFESWRKTEQGVRSDDWDVLAQAHESSRTRLWDHGWIQEETVEMGKSDC